MTAMEQTQLSALLAEDVGVGAVTLQDPEMPRRLLARIVLLGLCVVLAVVGLFYVKEAIWSHDYSADQRAGHRYAASIGILAQTPGDRVNPCTDAARVRYDDPLFMTPDHSASGGERAFWEGCSGASFDD